MKKSILVILSSLMLISAKDKLDTTGNNIGKNMVVLELFTSQGCSSCPPADALLSEYVRSHNEHIIALAFHVDYWNRLGWTDPFSDKAYSSRQYWYSSHLPGGSVYTPQLIVNGRGEALGNNRGSVGSLVQKELALGAAENITVENITIGKTAVGFHYKTLNTKPGEVLNIALVQKEVTTQIMAGENNGVKLTNHNIVRSFVTKALTADGVGEINLPPSFKASGYALVLYVQNKTSLSITAAVFRDL